MEITKTIVDKMKAGDIILVHKDGIGPYWGFFYWSHCLMYLGDNTLLHAGNPVQTTDIYTYFSNHTDITNFTVLRVKNITQSQLDGALAFAKSQIGKPYEMWSLYRLTKQLNPTPDNPGYGYYCTEIVWAAYFSQGIDLEIMPVGLVNPQEIYMTRKVDIVYIVNRWGVRTTFGLPLIRLY